jgi:hypothetical protein
MPREINESILSMYFNRVDGTTLKIDVPAPNPALTTAEVKAQMDAILLNADLFDINSIKDAGITNRTVSDFAVEA